MIKVTLTLYLLNFCNDDLLTFTCTLPDSVGYLCSRISPATTKPTTILGHGRLHTANCLWLRKTMPTQEHRPLILAEPPNLMGFTRFAIIACSHKVHSWGVAVRGRWPPSKLVQFMPTQKPHKHYNEGEELCSFKPCRERGAPPSCTLHVYVLAQGACQKPVDFFPKVCSMYLVIFTLLNRFPRAVIFQVSGTVYDAKTHQ